MNHVWIVDKPINKKKENLIKFFKCKNCSMKAYQILYKENKAYLVDELVLEDKYISCENFLLKSILL